VGLAANGISERVGDDEDGEGAGCHRALEVPVL
jgi:hypothetical protein